MPGNQGLEDKVHVSSLKPQENCGANGSSVGSLPTRHVQKRLLPFNDDFVLEVTQERTTLKEF